MNRKLTVFECPKINENYQESEAMPKGIAFVFSCGVERNENSDITGLDNATRQRLDRALALYHKGKIAYFVVCGGMFEKGLRAPVATMMKNYLIGQDISENIIFTERHSKDTNTNVLFGHQLIELISTRAENSLPDLADLPLYYISGKEHLERIRAIVEGQRKKTRFSRGVPRSKPNISQQYAFISSTAEESGSLLTKIKSARE